MEGVIFGFYAIGFILLMGMVNHIRAIWKPGLTMTRRSLKQRAIVLGLAGAGSVVIAVILTFLGNG